MALLSLYFSTAEPLLYNNISHNFIPLHLLLVIHVSLLVTDHCIERGKKMLKVLFDPTDQPVVTLGILLS